MLGLVNRALVEFVKELHGPDAVQQLRRMIGGKDDRYEVFLEYPHSTTEDLLNFVAALRSEDRNLLLDDLGTFAVSKLWGASLRDLMLSCGSDFSDFLQNLSGFLKAISFIDDRWRSENIVVSQKTEQTYNLLTKGNLVTLTSFFKGMLRTIADEFKAIVLIEHHIVDAGEVISIRIFDSGQSRRYIVNNNDPEYFELFVRAHLLQVIFEEAKGTIERLDGNRAVAELAATTDPLTGLLNRRGLQDWWSIHSSSTDVVAIAMLDLDRFKPINDQFGHAVGDEVLKAIAKRLQNQFRASDAVARIGGDEFVVVFLTSSEAQAILTAERVLTLFRDPVVVDNIDHEIGGSLGLALRFGSEPKSLNLAMQVADVGLYQAKSEGRGTFRLRSMIH